MVRNVVIIINIRLLGNDDIDGCDGKRAKSDGVTKIAINDVSKK